MMLKTLGKKLK